MKEKKKRTRPPYKKRRLFILTFAIFLIASAVTYLSNRPPSIYINHNGDDLLFYTFGTYVNDPNPNIDMLMMYNPRTNQRQAIMPKPSSWQVNSDGRIAFQNDQRTQIMVTDIESIGQQQEIIEASDGNIFLTSWSPQGRYLLYRGGADKFNLNHIYIWDGEQSIDITPKELTLSNNESGHLTLGIPMWSNEERLAFTVTKTVGDDAWYRVYIWDGEQSIDITPEELREPIDRSAESSVGDKRRNTYLSLNWSTRELLAITFNSRGDDISNSYNQLYIWDNQTVYSIGNHLGRWNSEGHLMLWDGSYSQYERLTNFGIYDERIPKRWDGKTYVDGQPKLEVIPDLDFDNTIYRASNWAYGNKIIYKSIEDGGYAQYYLWDGVNLSYVDGMREGFGNWFWRFNERGEQIRIGFDSTGGYMEWYMNSYIHLRDRNNNPIIEINGHTPTISQDGYIAFCARLHQLFIYNGHEEILIEVSGAVTAQWKNGGYLHCTNG